MNFFDAQDRARRATRWLILAYAVSTVLIVAGITIVVAFALFALDPTATYDNRSLLVGVAILATAVILGASLFKTAALSSGGGKVAQAMGGTPVPADVQDPLRRRLRNVVEEMAIASGVPVPEIYVLEEESGINAFAAGYTPGDAAIAVTRGTLELLDRSELQGVIAHEYSHILNGDMRLNIRMMGVLFGIMVIALIGRTVLRGSYHAGFVSSSRSRSSTAPMLIGLGLAILGWIGMFFARLIKAAVSRQREFLADASAVQFTRQTDGIANALKKIGGYSKRSFIERVDAEEVSHMLFANGLARLGSVFATHPPLTERIQALDPSFTDRDYPVVRPGVEIDRQHAEQVANLAAVTDVPPADFRPVTDNIAEAVGRPSPEHIAYAQRLRGSIPDVLYDAAHRPQEALLLALALVLDEAHVEQQLGLLEEQIGAARAALVRRYFDQIQEIGAAYHLPLLEVSFPTLKSRPVQQLEFLVNLVRRLIEIDNQVDLREFCFYRILTTHLHQAADPVAERDGNRVSKTAAREAAIKLIRIVADQGNADTAAREHAFAAGLTVFGKWAGEHRGAVAAEQTVLELERSLEILRRMNNAGRKSLLQAVSDTITHDGKLTATEAELLRAICASLDCPLPPIGRI